MEPALPRQDAAGRRSSGAAREDAPRGCARAVTHVLTLTDTAEHCGQNEPHMANARSKFSLSGNRKVLPELWRPEIDAFLNRILDRNGQSSI